MYNLITSLFTELFIYVRMTYETLITSESSSVALIFLMARLD